MRAFVACRRRCRNRQRQRSPTSKATAAEVEQGRLRRVGPKISSLVGPRWHRSVQGQGFAGRSKEGFAGSVQDLCAGRSKVAPVGPRARLRRSVQRSLRWSVQDGLGRSKTAFGSVQDGLGSVQDCFAGRCKTASRRQAGFAWLVVRGLVFAETTRSRDRAGASIGVLAPVRCS